MPLFYVAWMLYEYGIMSTYLQSIKDQSMPAYDYTSSSGVLSFNVPCHHEEDRIKGLNLYCLYGLLGSNDNAISVWAKISNISKGVTWVYNPLVYCKPRVDEDVVWLSYWPIGNILDVGDEVTVDIFFEERTMIISGCGASLVYMDGEVDDENCENNTTMTKEEEVIGGDLSEFEVTTGCYYLCRRDLFGSETSYWLKWMFGDNVHYTDSRGWRKTHRSILLGVLRNQANTFLKKIELGVGFNSKSDIDKIEKAVSSVVGVESVTTNEETGKLIVTGYVDPIEVATCVREFDNMVVEILSLEDI